MNTWNTHDWRIALGQGRSGTRTVKCVRCGIVAIASRIVGGRVVRQKVGKCKGAEAKP